VDGVVRWRRLDLARVIKTRFNVTLAERSVGAMLRRLGFRRLSVRPLPIWSPPQSRSMRANNRSNFGGRRKPGLASKAH
jgi:hypothetical protein